jgi:hypothetical protein
MLMSSSAAITPDGPGSVSGAPNLPAGFTDTFTSRYIDTVPGSGHYCLEEAPEGFTKGAAYV